jgi:preprotein translocase subunit SecG
MYYLVLVVHVIVCLFLMVVILLQSGKAADLAGAFGGMGSQTAFGPRGSATLLSKATTVSAAVFMITSMTLSILATKNAGVGTTVLEDTGGKSLPVKTAPPPPQQQGGPSQTVSIPIPPPSKDGKPVEVKVPAQQPPPAKK